MASRRVLARSLLALGAVSTALGFGFAGNPADATPTVCGYVRYSTSTGPSTTVSSIPYCDIPCEPGGDVGVHVGPDQVLGVKYEALACVTNI